MPDAHGTSEVRLDAPALAIPAALPNRAGLPIRVRLWLVGLGVLAAGLVSSAPAAAAPPVNPTVPAGFTIVRLAAAPGGATNCDDLASLEGHLFMGCQNKTLSVGGGGSSTLAEYTLSGMLVKAWLVKDKIDGIGADPLNHRVIVTENEDGNSHLFTLTPSAPAAQQIVNYTYVPDPRAPSAPPALHTGGGTDNVSVDSSGHILITGSHAGTKTGTAVFKVVLTSPSSPGATGTATLSPTFLDNATATNGKGSGTVKLTLGDVDSGTIVPADSPRFGGTYVVADQTAQQLVFSSNIFNGSGLTVLKTPFGLDDLRWATSDAGTLYVVNNGGTVAGASAIYKVTGPFKKGTVLASNDGSGDQVVTVNLTTGALTPFVRHLTTTKGLVYLDASGTESQLALNGAAAATSTASSSATPKKSGGSDNTAVIVIVIVAAVLLLGGFALARRRRAAG